MYMETKPPGAPLHRGFSLVELLIAVAILGFGLIVIGAALPVGLRFTRDTTEIQNGEAAADYALDVMASELRISRTAHADSLVRPRGAFVSGDLNTAQLLSDYEPLIKVRPLPVRQAGYTPGLPPIINTGLPAVERSAEQKIHRWLTGAGTGVVPPLNGAEDALALVREYELLQAAPSYRPPVSMMALLSPQVSPDGLVYYSPGGSLGLTYPRPNEGRAISPTELARASEHTISTSIFYRRTCHMNFASGANAPNLYEFIAIACRRPSPEHRFPRQNPNSIPVRAVGAPAISSSPADHFLGDGTLVPEPWMIVFEDLPAGPNFQYPVIDPLTPVDSPAALARSYERFLPIGAVNASPTTLTFRINEVYDPLLPKGSIFIPAVNDVLLGDRTAYDFSATAAAPPPFPQAGFVPSANDTLPIYKIVDRPDRRTVVVEFNGYFPWTDDWLPNQSPPPLRNTTYWPVWVIPPSYSEVVGGVPVLEKRSPIVFVERRTLSLKEIP